MTFWLPIQNPKSPPPCVADPPILLADKIQNSHGSYFACERGQALLELAIFGSLFIMALGVLVNYGLNADLTQQTLMASFRQALYDAGKSGEQGQPISSSYLLIRDGHIPNPANPFGIGSVVPTSAAAGGFVWGLRRGGRPDKESELPVLKIDVRGATCPKSKLSELNNNNNKPPCTYLAAGFRKETIPAESLQRYREVYGFLNVCDKASCCGNEGCGDGCRVPIETRINSTGTEEQVCGEPIKNVRIIDSCEGEIINYDVCVRQARMIVDADACRKQCEKEKSPGSQTNCGTVCSRWIDTPWYAQEARLIDQATQRYRFPKLENLFRGRKALGLQPDSVKRTTTKNELTKEENEREIVSTTTIDWHDETRRTVVYRDAVTGALVTPDITAEKNERKPMRWRPVQWP